MTNRLVSVLMPVYNAEQYLKQSLESIYKQSYGNYEIIIVNDGSTDSSLSIIHSASDSRIVVLNNERRKGLSFCLNRAIAKARGDYLIRADADDISHPKRFELLVRALESDIEIGVCGSWIKTFGDVTEGVWKYPCDNATLHAMLPIGPPFAHPSVIMRKSIFNDNDIYYDTDYLYAQDYDLWERLSGKTVFANINKVLLRYRIHKNQVGQYHKLEQDRSADKVRIRILNKMNIKPTSQEIQIHKMICNNSIISSRESLDIAHQWLLKLVSQNDTFSILPRKEFRKIVGLKWCQVCLLAFPPGFSASRKCRLSPLWKRAGFTNIEKFMFFIQSFNRRRS